MKKNKLLTQSQQLLLSAFEKSFPAAIQLAEETLFQDAERSTNSIESGVMLTARALLSQHHDSFTTDCTQALKALTQGNILAAYTFLTPTFDSKSIRADSLSLIDATVYEEELFIDDLTAMIRSGVAASLVELNTRVAVLFEQQEILERENPFRPYVFSQTVISALEAFNPPAEIQEAIVTRLHQHLPPLVNQIYQEINQFLAQQGVTDEIKFIIRKAPDGNVPTHEAQSEIDLPSTSTENEAIPENGYQQQVSQLESMIDDMLAQDFDSVLSQVRSKGNTAETQIAPSTPQGWRHQVGKIGGLIRDFFSGDDTSIPLAQPTSATTPTPLLEAVSANIAEPTSEQPLENQIAIQRNHLQALANDPTERLIIDLIAMLFELILSDQDVPAEIRAQIGRLQFVVLKIALKDPSLFNEKQHPARLLVNQLGSASLTLHEVDPTGEKLISVVKEMINTLVEDNGEHLDCFQQQLDTLAYFIETQLALHEHLHGLEAHLNEAVDKTNQYLNISNKLASLLQQLAVEPIAYDFIVHTWSNVLAQAANVKDENENDYILLVSKLIWSILPKKSSSDRSVLFKLIPEMNDMLKSGLRYSDQPLEQYKPFFAWLVNAHMKSLRGGEIVSESNPLAEASLTDISLLITTQLAKANLIDDNQLTSDQGKRYFKEVLKKLETTLVEFTLDKEDISPQSSEHTGQSLAMDNTLIKQKLKAGVAVSITLADSTIVAVLRWVNHDAHHFVMSIKGQTHPVMLDSDTLMRLIQNNQLRFLDENPLFERAVSSILLATEQLPYFR